MGREGKGDCRRIKMEKKERRKEGEEEGKVIKGGRVRIDRREKCVMVEKGKGMMGCGLAIWKCK